MLATASAHLPYSEVAPGHERAYYKVDGKDGRLSLAPTERTDAAAQKDSVFSLVQGNALATVSATATRLRRLFTTMFLPAGYPESVGALRVRIRQSSSRRRSRECQDTVLEARPAVYQIVSSLHVHRWPPSI